MPSGGNGSRRKKGARFEARVVHDQERIGRWSARLRSGGGETVDVVALDGNGVYFIQCKVSGPYLVPWEREQLVDEARSAGATPLVAWRDGTKIQYKELT